MGQQTYRIVENGVHTIVLTESVPGGYPQIIDDTVFAAFVTWLQSESIIGTTDLLKSVLRPEEEIT
jgi:hypothetical protein